MTAPARNPITLAVKAGRTHDQIIADSGRVAGQVAASTTLRARQ